jgi:hypothetical protein
MAATPFQLPIEHATFGVKGAAMHAWMKFIRKTSSRYDQCMATLTVIGTWTSFEAGAKLLKVVWTVIEKKRSILF